METNQVSNNSEESKKISVDQQAGHQTPSTSQQTSSVMGTSKDKQKSIQKKKGGMQVIGSASGSRSGLRLSETTHAGTSHDKKGQSTSQMMQLSVNSTTTVPRVNTSHGGINSVSSIVQGKPPVTKRGLDNSSTKKESKTKQVKKVVNNLSVEQSQIGSKKKNQSYNDLVDQENEERKTTKSDQKMLNNSQQQSTQLLNSKQFVDPSTDTDLPKASHNKKSEKRAKETGSKIVKKSKPSFKHDDKKKLDLLNPTQQRSNSARSGKRTIPKKQGNNSEKRSKGGRSEQRDPFLGQSEDENSMCNDTDVNRIQPPDTDHEIQTDVSVKPASKQVPVVKEDGKSLLLQVEILANNSSNSNTSQLKNGIKREMNNSHLFNSAAVKYERDERSLDLNKTNDLKVEDNISQENLASSRSNDSPKSDGDINQNITEKFRLAMKQQILDGRIGGNNKLDLLMPPPEDLIKKSVIDDEPVKTGAPIAFIKFQRLLGKERIEKLNPEYSGKQSAKGGIQGSKDTNQNGQLQNNSENPTGIVNANTISDYMINAREANQLVYCRFGEKYITDLEKRKSSNISALNQPMNNLGSASYIINIKKLVEEHNIEGEKRDFKSMKTGSMKLQLPPESYYKLQGPEDKTLLFESRFESGNLLAAIKVSDVEYDLILQNDINTNGHTQWYFFRVGNTKAGQKVKFNILNLAKPDSLYNYGMKILCFSNKVKETEGVGWHRVGEKIAYIPNQYKRDNNRFFRTYYSLTFTHTFAYEDDQQFFAHCFPYTYSDLQEDLNRIDKIEGAQNFFHKGTLTRTLAGNRCEYLTITSKDKDPKSAKAMAKKGIFISARVHPGESNASWMMKGVIEFLVGNSPEARALREHFVFKIVPILNPDGVINGNYRCSLSGQDLNRRWKTPNKILHPVNFCVKKLIRQFAKERELVLYCDLHGHSRRKNIFMYGNNLREQPHSTRVFPYILSKICDYFSFEQSRFSMNKSKDGTARIAMFKELNIPNIFTMEASFCGADRGQYKDQHFSTDYLMLAGQRLLEALIVYSKINVKTNLKELYPKKQEVNQEEKAVVPSYTDISALELEKELTQNKKLINMTMGEEGNSSGSDSEPSADNLEEDEMAKLVPLKKKAPPPKIEKKPVLPPKKAIAPIKKPTTSPPAQKRPAPVVKEISRSPTKRPFGYYPFDRLSLRKRKPEMKDAWTQTTPKSKEQQEREKREQRQRKNQQYLLLQQQQAQQQMMMQKYQAQMQMQQHRGSYQLLNQSADQNKVSAQHPSQQYTNLTGTLGDLATRNQLQSQQKPATNTALVNQQPTNNSQLQNNSQAFQQQKQLQQNRHEGGQSPSPQIRIRTNTDTFKQKPSNDLAKYEERLLSDKRPVEYNQTGFQYGPQHGSMANAIQHRGSNKRLPQIQSSNSQRKSDPVGASKVFDGAGEYQLIQRQKTLNQGQFGGNPPMPQGSALNHQRQISGQSPSHHQTMLSAQYNQQQFQNQSQGARRIVNASQMPYHDQNSRANYHSSVSPNKLNRLGQPNDGSLSGKNQIQQQSSHLVGGGFSSSLSYVNQSQQQAQGHSSITTFYNQGNIKNQNTWQNATIQQQQMKGPPNSQLTSPGLKSATMTQQKLIVSPQPRISQQLGQNSLPKQPVAQSEQRK